MTLEERWPPGGNPGKEHPRQTGGPGPSSTVARVCWALTVPGRQSQGRRRQRGRALREDSGPECHCAESKDEDRCEDSRGRAEGLVEALQGSEQKGDVARLTL